MKVIGCLLALVFLSVTSAHAQALATLRVKSEKTAGGIVTLVLQSGKVIEVPESDLVKGAGLTITNRNSTGPDIQPNTSGQDATIRAKCEREWPTDFSTRAYCERSQREAVAKLQARAMSTPDQRIIRTKCQNEWPDDFSTRNYCEESQLKALQQLGR